MPPARLRKIVRQANALKPDLVLIAGDLVSDERPSTRTYSLEDSVAPLRELESRLGGFAVLGNHDHWRNATDAGLALEDAGIQLLNNSAIRAGPLSSAVWTIRLLAVTTSGPTFGPSRPRRTSDFAQAQPRSVPLRSDCCGADGSRSHPLRADPAADDWCPFIHVRAWSSLRLRPHQKVWKDLGCQCGNRDKLAAAALWGNFRYVAAASRSATTITD